MDESTDRSSLFVVAMVRVSRSMSKAYTSKDGIGLRFAFGSFWLSNSADEFQPSEKSLDDQDE